MYQGHVRDKATPTLNVWKAELFRHDPDIPIILHRKDILQKKGPFGILRDERRRDIFDEFIVDYLNHTEFTVITVVLDKKAMLNQIHWREKHPYHYLMNILVEKYVQWLERRNAIGDVMPERRRGKKDNALQRAFLQVRQDGTNYVSSDRILTRIPSEKLKFRSKADNVTGLQICDLIAHPSHMYIRRLQNHPVLLGPFAQRIVPILTRQKYDRSPYTGRISGYGIKYLP